MKQILWIYEYKDDKTSIGATIFEDEINKLPADFKLPHLRGDWYWRVEVLIEKEDKDF